MDDECLPIDAYGVIGNDNRFALVGRNGSIDWCCFPHLESPSVFAAILDAEDGGRFAVRPADEYEASHEYVDRTNVLETTFETDDGTVTVTDFMPVRADPAHEISADAADERDTKRDDERPGGSAAERFQQAIYRKVECTSGSVDLDVVFEPQFDYARSTARLDNSNGDVIATEVEHDGRDGDEPASHERDRGSADESRERESERDRHALTLRTDIDLEIESDGAGATATVDEGETCWFRLQYGTVDDSAAPVAGEYEEVLEETIDYWRSWLDSCEESATDIFAFDDEWRAMLSTEYDRDVMTISCIQNAELEHWDYFEDMEPLFRAYDGRPHWGKKHTLRADELRELYPEWDRFRELRRELDPEGVFMTDYLEDLLEGDAEGSES